MEIYVEYVLIDNLVINYILLFLVAKCLKIKVAFLRLAISTCFGTICAFVFPVIKCSSFVLISLKLCVGLFMTLICFSNKKIKNYLLCFLLFLSATAIMGGLCFFVLFLLTDTTSGLVLSAYDLPVPMGLIFFVLAIYVYLMCSVINYFQKRKKLDNFVYSVEFCTLEKIVKANAFLDTGNTLCDPITNKPVIIINYDLFSKLFDIPIESLLTKNVTSKIENSHYIEYGTIANKKKQILVFEISKIEIEINEQKLIKNQTMLGLSFAKLSNLQNCSALLNPQIF